MAWITKTQNFTAEDSGRYFCYGSSQLEVSLPLNPTNGISFSLYALNTAGWVIVQRSDEQINLWGTLSTYGESGGIQNGNMGDVISLAYSSDVGQWQVTNYQGNVEIF